MKYEEVEKLVIKAIEERYCLFSRIQNFIQKKADEVLPYDELNDVLSGMISENKIVFKESGAISAYFLKDKVPTRFWLNGTDKLKMDFTPQVKADLDKHELKRLKKLQNEKNEKKVKEICASLTVDFIKILAKKGLTHEEAAKEIGISRTTFQNQIKKPEFQQAWLANHPTTNKPSAPPQFREPTDGGRPRMPIDYEEVERVASEFPTDTEIAKELTIGRETLRNRLKTDKDFFNAYTRGRAISENKKYVRAKPIVATEIKESDQYNNIVISEEQYCLIQDMAADNASMEMIAEYLNIARRTLYSRLEKDEKLKTAIEVGREIYDGKFNAADMLAFGKEGLTQRQIADRLGISESGLAIKFRDKAQLHDAWQDGLEESRKIATSPLQTDELSQICDIPPIEEQEISHICDNGSNTIKEFPPEFEVFTQPQKKQTGGKDKVTRNKLLGVADFVLCPPELRIDVEKEVASSAIEPPEAARAHILYSVYQNAWQRMVKDEKNPTEQINADLSIYRQQTLDLVEAVQKDKLIEEDDSWALTIVMCAALFTGFREGLVRKITGFDKYFVEGVLVSMLDNYFWCKDGSTNIDWFDEETKGFSFVTDFLAVAGSVKRWLDENGKILYQATGEKREKFLGDLPMKCKCGNKITLATWKENIKQVQSVFSCAECFEHKDVEVAEPIVEEPPTVEPELLEPPEEPQKNAEIITKNITEFTPATVEGDEVSITFNVAYGSYLQLLALTRLEEGMTIEDVLQQAIDHFLEVDTYERRDAFKNDMREELKYILNKYQDNYSPLEVKRNDLLEWLLAEIFEEKEMADDDQAPRYVYDLKIDLMEYLSVGFLKQIRPLKEV